MICLASDTHGAYDLQKVLDEIELVKLMKTEDESIYLILLGDVMFGIDEQEDAYVKNTLLELDVIVLFLDGNHENFDKINSYPVTEWNGGMVHAIVPGKFLHLMRGYCFTIENKKFFTFGGAFSAERSYGGKGISWWEEELPDREEYDRGLETLAHNGNQVDYILTHSAPQEIAEKICGKKVTGEKELQEYFQKIYDACRFKMWYGGHFHEDIVLQNYQCLMQEVVKIA